MKRAAPKLLLFALSVSFVSCEFVSQIFGGPGVEVGADRPRIPAPTSYIAEVPLTSDELIVATVPLTDFVPTVTNAKNEEGNDVVTSSSEERVQLVLNGNPTPSPTFNEQSTPPLENTPFLQLVRYWKRLGPVQRYSGATTTTITRSYTQGSSRTETSSFAFTLGVSTTVSGDALFASTSVTVSAEFSAEFEEEVTISESVTESNTFEVAAGQDENIVFTVWQLVEEYRFVTNGETAGAWIPFEDPHYTFLATDLAPLVGPTTEVVKYSWAFENVERKTPETLASRARPQP